MSRGFINNGTFYRLKSNDCLLPRAYGLAKIHKKDIPLRIIVSFINSPFYSFASFLHKIILKSLPLARSNIINSFKLYERFSNFQLNNNDILLSLDVVSLFTNVPTELAISGLKNKWFYISKNTSIPLDEFLIAITFVLSSTYFTFDDVIYKQTFGNKGEPTPMGSPLLPLIADIIL